MYHQWSPILSPPQHTGALPLCLKLTLSSSSFSIRNFFENTDKAPKQCNIYVCIFLREIAQIIKNNSLGKDLDSKRSDLTNASIQKLGFYPFCNDTWLCTLPACKQFPKVDAVNKTAINAIQHVSKGRIDETFAELNVRHVVSKRGNRKHLKLCHLSHTSPHKSDEYQMLRCCVSHSANRSERLFS